MKYGHKSLHGNSSFLLYETHNDPSWQSSSRGLLPQRGNSNLTNTGSLTKVLEENVFIHAGKTILKNIGKKGQNDKSGKTGSCKSSLTFNWPKDSIRRTGQSWSETKAWTKKYLNVDLLKIWSSKEWRNTQTLLGNIVSRGNYRYSFLEIVSKINYAIISPGRKLSIWQPFGPVAYLKFGFGWCSGQQVAQSNNANGSSGI